MRIGFSPLSRVDLRDLWAPARLERAVPLLLAFAAALLWARSLGRVDVRRMNDLGLISVLPPAILVALLLLTAGFCLALKQRRPAPAILLPHVVTLIVMLYGITAFVEEAPRFAVAWLHAGFSEYIARTGGLAPEIDARFSWPGFFILSAFFTEIAGLPSAMHFVAWAPLAFNLLYLGPLFAILDLATPDKRLTWLGVWFFYLTNWIGQDYFSPQALNYFLYLVILAVLLRWFGQPGTRAEAAADGRARFRLLATLRPDSVTAWRRAGLLGLVVLVYALVVSSHQLTPFFTLGAVTVLVVFRRCSLRGLPVLMAVMLAAWISFLTVTFLAGHLGSLLSSIGHLGNAVNDNVTGRLRGSPQHLLVVYVRMLMTVAIWGLAFLGGVRRLRRGYRDLTCALLAVAPFPFLVLQPYGGEMLLRIYLFALPFMAFFAAALVFPAPEARMSPRLVVATAAVSLLLLAGFLFSRYGNERMDYVTAAEVAAVRHLYSVAEPGSRLVAVAPNLPWRYRDLEKFDYAPAGDPVLVDDVDQVVRLMSDTRYPESYLILTRSQKAYVELFAGMPPGVWERFEQNLASSGRFRLIFANEDSKIFVLERGAMETGEAG